MADVLLQNVIQRFSISPPTIQLLMRVGADLAQQVNKLPGMKGREKLELVQHLLREALRLPAVKEKISADVFPTLLSAIDDIIPEAITLIVSAGRGDFSFKKPSASCVSAVVALLCRGSKAMGISLPPQVVEMSKLILPVPSEKEPGDVGAVAANSVDLVVEPTSSESAPVSDIPSSPA